MASSNQLLFAHPWQIWLPKTRMHADADPEIWDQKDQLTTPSFRSYQLEWRGQFDANWS
jgi:hypothetical protein